MSEDAAADYININRTLWDGRVGHHIGSGFYAVDDFKQGKSSLTEIELPLLGDVRGKDILHLQCHFGQDTLSLARMGAQATGLDFSPKAIAAAQVLAAELLLDARFICADVYDAPSSIAQPADMVFTTYGVIGWLPDMARWAQVVADCLRAGGELLLAEFHPVMWMYDNDFIRPTYSYFNREPIIEAEEGTYADRSADIAYASVGWNHPVGEVFGALTAAGLRVTHFQEYDFSPYPAFKGSVQVAEKRWNIGDMEGLLPMVYSLKAVKY